MSIISSNSANYASAILPKFLLRGSGACAVETQKCSCDVLCQQVCSNYGKTYHISNTFVKDLVEMAKREGRLVYGLDCSTIASKYDAIGWLRALSEQPCENNCPKIVVIENITELRSDEMRYILVHAWKNKENMFLDDRPGYNDTFVISISDYLVYLTWDVEKKQELKKIWHPGDGFTWIGNYEKWKNSILKTK